MIHDAVFTSTACKDSYLVRQTKRRRKGGGGIGGGGVRGFLLAFFVIANKLNLLKNPIGLMDSKEQSYVTNISTSWRLLMLGVTETTWYTGKTLLGGLYTNITSKHPQLKHFS